MDAQKKQNVKKPVAVILILILCLCVAGIVMTILSQRSAIPTVREALVYVGYISCPKDMI